MDLSALEQYLDGQGDPLTLNAGDSNLPQAFRDFVNTVPGRQVILSPSGGSGIVLLGTTLTISGSSSDTWPVQGMADVSAALSDVTITIDNGGSEPVIDGVATALLPLNESVHAPVTITALHQEANPWQIELSQDASDVTLTDLLLLGKEWDLPFDVPSDLGFIRSQPLAVVEGKFQITFYPNTTYEVRYSFALSAPEATWNLIDGILSFTGIDLDAFVMTHSMSVTLIGHLNVGGVDVDVGVTLSMGENWVAFVRPPGGTFPGLAALASWIGDSSLSGDATTGFGNVNFDTGAFDEAIESVSVGFNWKNASLNYLDIKSLLRIGVPPGELQLDVVLRLPDIEVIGSLHDDTPVKVKDMLSFFGLPTDTVPDDMSITAVSFDAQPKHSYYSAGMTVDNVWQVGPVNLEEISLLVSYYGVDGFTGQFYGVLNIGEIATVDLEAEYDAGAGCWNFAGGVDFDPVVSLTDLVTEVAALFGWTMPSRLPDIELHDFSITFTTLPASSPSGSGLDFDINCSGSISEDSFAVDIKINIGATSFTGELEFGSARFQVDFGGRDTSSMFVATFNDPDGVEFVWHDIFSTISQEIAAAIPASLSLTLSSAFFIYYKTTSSSTPNKMFLFGVGFDAAIGMGDLPLIGSVIEIPHDCQVNIKDVCVWVASKPVDQTLLTSMTSAVAGSEQLMPKTELRRGLNLSVTLEMGSVPSHLTLPVVPQAQQASTAPAVSGTNQIRPAAGASVGNAVWFTIQKQLGPFNLRRVGMKWHNDEKRLGVLLDASLTASALTLGLMGLEASFPLDDLAQLPPDLSDVNFDLSGLEIGYRAGAIEMDGAFVHSGNAYLGEAKVKTTRLMLTAIGAYQIEANYRSLFIFAMLNSPPLGGPPYFFVTGLAGGFGYNSHLNLPQSVEEVRTFSLVAGALPPGPSVGGVSNPFASVDQSQPSSALTALSTLGSDISPCYGENWLAVGVRFTSFRLVQSFALVTISFGQSFQVALLGRSQISIPPNVPNPRAYAEVDIRAVFKPDAGEDSGLFVDGALTSNSYILTPSCRLTGGFAFYLWLSGDFVLTFGGYHPDFAKPDKYPDPPRLGINWRINSHTSLRASMYFALTPAAMMVGGSLSLTWHSGSINAWFDVEANFLMYWKPFHFVGDFHIHLGVRVKVNVLLGTVTLGFHLGVDIALHGPPLGGTAHIDLSVVSFTISFGSAPAKNPVLWSEFKGFIQGPEATGDTITSGRVVDGLIKDLSKDASAEVHGEQLYWIINPQTFVIAAETAAPAQRVTFNSGGDAGVSFSVQQSDDKASHSYLSGTWDDWSGETGALGVNPMEISSSDGFSSEFKVSIQKWTIGANGNRLNYCGRDWFRFEPVYADAPKALWSSQAPDDSLGSDSTFPHSLVGVRIYPKHLAEDVTQPVELKKLQFTTAEIVDTVFSMSAPAVSGPASGTIQGTIESNSARTAIWEALQGTGILTEAPQDTVTRDLADALHGDPPAGCLGQAYTN